jgi:uncharacterized protein (DUF302 family)
MDASGLVTVPSAHPPAETVGRLMAALAARGVTVFACIDHAAGAAEAGMALRPTTLLVFGNPQAGTPLMQATQTIGIDLPLRALVWQDAEGVTRLSIIYPGTLAARHGLDPAAVPSVAAMTALLAAVSKEATT